MSTFTRLFPALATIILVASGCGGSEDATKAANAPSPAVDASRPTSTDAPPDDTKDSSRSEPSPDGKDADDRDRDGDRADQDRADRDRDGDDGKGTADSDDSGDTRDSGGSGDADGPSTLEVSGASFDTLAFEEVACLGEGTDLLVQTESTDDPLVVLTVLFGDGGAVQATAQTDPDSDQSTIWSDDDADSLARTVTRDGDTVALDETELASFDDGESITLSGTLTCTST